MMSLSARDARNLNDTYLPFSEWKNKSTAKPNTEWWITQTVILMLLKCKRGNFVLYVRLCWVYSCKAAIFTLWYDEGENFSLTWGCMVGTELDHFHELWYKKAKWFPFNACYDTFVIHLQKFDSLQSF